MIKPETCRMHVEYCENCEDWEPIPFHDEGGVCLRHRAPVRCQLPPDFVRRAAEIRPRDVEVATGLR